MSVQVLLLLLLLLMGTEGAQEVRPPVRIGVIGAGIGGTSAAYFLRQKFGREVHIDVFERGEVGGRLATQNVDGEDYESGGVLILPENEHMMHFIRELRLSTIPRGFSPGGVYNGEEFVFRESGSKIWDLLQSFWKYGFAPLRLKLWISEGVNRIKRIYGRQAQDEAFSSNEELFRALGEAGCARGLNQTIGESLRESGFSSRFIAEMVTPYVRFNYGQGAEANCFVGLASLLGTIAQARSVEGGNKMVCRGLLSASEARFISGTVLSLEQKTPQKGQTEKQYEVTFYSESGVYSETYDIVLIAAPLQPEKANITFLNFNPPIPQFSRPYFRSVVTFVCGRINATFFGYGDPSQFKLRSILTTDNPQLFIDSTFIEFPVRSSALSGAPLWKVFSPEPLTEEQLNLLFSSYETVEEKRWWAWPEFYTPIELPPIILHHHLYYLNGIELLASAMEMSSIAAKNAALLAHRRWYGKQGEEEQERRQTEL